MREIAELKKREPEMFDRLLKNGWNYYDSQRRDLMHLCEKVARKREHKRTHFLRMYPAHGRRVAFGCDFSEPRSATRLRFDKISSLIDDIRWRSRRWRYGSVKMVDGAICYNTSPFSADWLTSVWRRGLMAVDDDYLVLSLTPMPTPDTYQITYIGQGGDPYEGLLAVRGTDTKVWPFKGDRVHALGRAIILAQRWQAKAKPGQSGSPDVAGSSERVGAAA